MIANNATFSPLSRFSFAKRPPSRNTLDIKQNNIPSKPESTGLPAGFERMSFPLQYSTSSSPAYSRTIKSKYSKNLLINRFKEKTCNTDNFGGRDMDEGEDYSSTSIDSSSSSSSEPILLYSSSSYSNIDLLGFLPMNSSSNSTPFLLGSICNEDKSFAVHSIPTNNNNNTNNNNLASNNREPPTPIFEYAFHPSWAAIQSFNPYGITSKAGNNWSGGIAFGDICGGLHLLDVNCEENLRR